MKTEQAIKLLHRLQDEQFDGIHGDERREALEMAVRALEGDGDTISRKMAIDAVAKWFYDVFGIKESDGTATIFKRLRELPPAQPERQVELDGAESNIEILSELRAQFNCFDEAEEPCYRALSDAICALSAQPHWIPFAERMPAFGESVLVQFDDDDMDILTFPNIYKRLKRVAWMPLPKPYGGESDGT